MSKPSISYKSELIKDLLNKEDALGYLNAALTDGSQEVFLLALRDVAEAYGMKKLSDQAHLNRENLYRMLSESGNPHFSSLVSLLQGLGFRLTVQTL